MADPLSVRGRPLPTAAGATLAPAGHKARRLHRTSGAFYWQNPDSPSGTTCVCGCAVWEGTRHARCCLAASQHVTHSLGVVRQVPYVLAVGAAPGRGRGGGGGPPPLRSTTAPVTDVCRRGRKGGGERRGSHWVGNTVWGAAVYPGEWRQGGLPGGTQAAPSGTPPARSLNFGRAGRLAGPQRTTTSGAARSLADRSRAHVLPECGPARAPGAQTKREGKGRSEGEDGGVGVDSVGRSPLRPRRRGRAPPPPQPRPPPPTTLTVGCAPARGGAAANARACAL